MATELKTTLELDIKPFLDAIKLAVNNLKVLEEIRPTVDPAELQKLNTQINNLNPIINVGLDIDNREILQTEQEINGLVEDPVRLDVLVNSEEIQTSVNRVRELRATALNLPPLINLNVDTNVNEVLSGIDEIRTKAIQQINQGDYVLDVRVEGIDDILTSITRITKPSDIQFQLTPEIERTLQSLQLTEETLRRISSLGFGDLVNDADNAREAFDQLQRAADNFGVELRDLDFSFSEEGFNKAQIKLEEILKTTRELQKVKLQQLFPGLAENIAEDAAQAGNLRDAINQVQNALKANNILDIQIDQEALDKLNTAEIDVRNLQISLEKLGVSKQINVDLQGEENVKRELNLIEKDVKDIPNQKNIKINIDQAGINNLQKTTSAIGGFAGQLGSGLLASFSGAAIGAAIANFGTQAVRAIVSASDAADELQDKLKLAFTQAGAEGFVLDENLRRANEFAFQLGDNFGISIRRSQELLAQVVGLTGEFGATSEAITKASLGIEEATGGLVKAETAAKLFSRSIGNPEDEAALATLAKRFPAIGEAIQQATDPAEKANAVLSNLTGTFTALEEKAQGFGENFQLLSEVAFGTFATAVVPIADSLVPILERLTALIIDNADEIESLGQSIVNNFIDPLLTQIDKLAPAFENFFTNLGNTLSIIATTGFGNLTNNLELIAFSFGVIGDILRVLNPLLETVASTLGQLIQPIVQTLSGDLSDLNNPLAELTGGLLDFNDNAFALAPVLETLANLFELLEPLIIGVSNVIYISLLGALDALEVQLGLVLLPFRALNLAFDLGKGLIQEYGDSVRNFVNNLSNYIPTVFLFVQGLNLLSKLTSQPLGRIDIGTTTPIEKLDSTLFDATDQAQKFNQQFGVVIPKGLSTFGNSIKSATGATKETSSALANLLKSYENLSKVIGSRFDIEIAKNELIQKQQQENAGRQLTDLENIYFEQLKITAELEKQKKLEEGFAGLIGVRSDSLTELANKYLETGDLATLPISFDPTNPQSVEEARRIAETIVKLVTDRVNLQARESEYKFDLTNVELQLDRDVITSQFNAIQEDIQRQLTDLQFGRISLQGFDVEGIRSSLTTIRDLAQASLKPFEDRLKTTRTEIESLTNELNLLRASGGENSTQFTELQGRLRIATDSFNTLNSQTQIYRDTVQQTQSQLENLGNTLEEAISNRLQRISRDFQRLGDRQELEITVALNTEGVNEGLIEIERNFARSVNAIQQNFAEIEARLRIEQNAPTGPLQQAEQLATAQAQALRNITTQRELAIRQFRLQNDAFFAINEALRNNLASALSPDTTAANRAFNERKKSLDSELELLRTNLDLGIISYQEYNEKVLNLEKQKADSIKQLEEETNQARLEGLQRIANEALPAITNELIASNIELTNLLKDGSAQFTDVANKSLETIGLVAAQSLGLAIQQAKSLEDVQRLFIRNIVSGLLKVLNIQLTAAIIGALLTEVQQKSFLGLATGAIIGGVITALFAAAEAKILQQLGGFESGGYTGDAGTKEVAGVVHGQEFVVNARGTKGNRELLEWLNKGKPAESFFDTKPADINVNNYVDTKAINQTINGLAYTMDSRLSSLENTVDRAIRQNATLTKSANQLDVSVYSDPGTAIKYMKKIGKIKGLS